MKPRTTMFAAVLAMSFALATTPGRANAQATYTFSPAEWKYDGAVKHVDYTVWIPFADDFEIEGDIGLRPRAKIYGERKANKDEKVRGEGRLTLPILVAEPTLFEGVYQHKKTGATDEYLVRLKALGLTLAEKKSASGAKIGDEIPLDLPGYGIDLEVVTLEIAPTVVLSYEIGIDDEVLDGGLRHKAYAEAGVEVGGIATAKALGHWVTLSATIGAEARAQANLDFFVWGTAGIVAFDVDFTLSLDAKAKLAYGGPLIDDGSKVLFQKTLAEKTWDLFTKSFVFSL